MGVNVGFKRTEVGMVPEEWECRDLSFVDLLTGFPFPSSGYSRSGVRLLRGSNIKRGCTDWSEDLTQFWSSVTADIRKYSLRSGDVVVAMDGSLVGRSFAALTEDDLPALLLQRVARLRSEAASQGYLKHWVCSARFTTHCDSVKTTTAIPHISPSDIRSFRIALPPTKGEQEAIAEALSDADTLIESLGQLLAKKRQIKQGAMQELLTGKQRLPGFSGNWETTRLGQIGSTYGGLTGKSKQDFGHGPARFITFMNIMSNVVIDCASFDAVDVQPNESQNRAAKGDLFFNGSSETPEEVGMCAYLDADVQDVYLNSFCFGFRARIDASVDRLFLAYYFRSNQGRELLKSLAQGATRYNLSKTALLRVEFPLPKVEEQTAIATILSDMDTELTVLESRLTKARQLKQGMMQELLTGRIRLV